MTAEQEARLAALEPRMREIARMQHRQNDFNRLMNQCDDLRHFLTVSRYGFTELGRHTAEEWIAIAEKALEVWE